NISFMIVPPLGLFEESEALLALWSYQYIGLQELAVSRSGTGRGPIGRAADRSRRDGCLSTRAALTGTVRLGQGWIINISSPLALSGTLPPNPAALPCHLRSRESAHPHNRSSASERGYEAGAPRTRHRSSGV